MAPPSNNFSKVRKDGYMLAEIYDRQYGKKPVGRPQQIHVHPSSNAINCFEAAQKYGGVKICEVYDKKQPMRNTKFYY